MKPDDQEQSLYYREIARHFLARRGAPFFLSAKDLDLVSSWAAAGVPLEVVLEGVDKAFEIFRMKQHRAEKILSLSFCSAQVLRAFEQQRDRKIGRRGKTVSRQEKRDRAQAEIERFLAGIPAEVLFLKEVYEEARQKMADGDIPDERLEELEEKVEGLLLVHAGEEGRVSLKKEIRAEGRRPAKGEWNRVMDTLLIKHLRGKYKIPYLSLFYY